MSWAHEHLGIAIDADERAIKRAYAAKLRTTRPDEDPAGFQRLNEAYQQALRIAAWRDANDEDMGEVDTVEDEDRHDAGQSRIDRDAASWRPIAGPPAARTPPPLPQPNASALPPPVPIDARHSRSDLDDIDDNRFDANESDAPFFDFDAFFESVEIRIHGTYPPDFAQWLDRHPVLRDAHLKRRIGMRLPQFLKARPTLPTGHVEALIHCFGFSASNAGTTGADDAGFDPGTFFDLLEIEVHRSSPAEFRRWLESHPDLYDIALKQRLAMPLLRFVECRPNLPTGHVHALVAFFNLDKVDAHFVHERVQSILTRSDPALEFRQSAPERNQGGYFPIWPIIFLVIVLSRCASGNF